jgi:hypothetical protein
MTRITLTQRKAGNGESSSSSSNPILGNEKGGGDPSDLGDDVPLGNESDSYLKYKPRRTRPLARGTIKSGNEDYIDSQVKNEMKLSDQQFIKIRNSKCHMCTYACVTSFKSHP